MTTEADDPHARREVLGGQGYVRGTSSSELEEGKPSTKRGREISWPDEGWQQEEGVEGRCIITQCPGAGEGQWETVGAH